MTYRCPQLASVTVIDRGKSVRHPSYPQRTAPLAVTGGCDINKFQRADLETITRFFNVPWC